MLCNMNDMTEIDACGLRCPLPVLRLRKVLERLPAGTLVRLQATDPMAQIDVPHFCGQSGHDVLAVSQSETVHIFVIRCGSAQ